MNIINEGLRNIFVKSFEKYISYLLLCKYKPVFDFFSIIFTNVIKCNPHLQNLRNIPVGEL